jgi:hypothetical protein
MTALPNRALGEADDTHSRAIERRMMEYILADIARLQRSCTAHRDSTDVPGLKQQLTSFLNDLDEIVHDNLPTRDRWEAKIRGE